ncbi:oxygen-insensitive NADPH nitroreductase [Bacillus suaedaesalsae]|uniref:Oxygen-insensitive NADPH nitroreductase n=1 Tax=Bacillus suaedaesalsae TaxID=2810349 RepID=A0ABS2DH24_9BACI|nr:oxygen-insensitive NADPH nitroreductase [Bacillus suaedaesalsae]MBM6616843.1 oxygen-insensitive NADPH nitroreductase [Bacillus suaedaesalsae]
MNSTIETILNHRSIRDFEDKLLSDEQIITIINCAQAASTSSFIQAYSIIGVNDVEKKKELAQLSGNQSYVEKNGHFFVFCADFHRHDVVSEMEDVDLEPALESTERFMIGLIDATIAAQNAALAAESMGLGICYIGGIRNNLEAVCDVLQTPKRVIPLFGLAVGYPKTITGQKPRLPFTNVYHENVYQQDHKHYTKQLEQYNETITEYYQERTNGARKDTWTAQMANMLKEPKRMYMKKFVEEKGFNKR